MHFVENFSKFIGVLDSFRLHAYNLREYLELEHFMKKTIKRILPIFLCIIVLCSIAWYLFSYDRGFTQDLMLSGARLFERQGSHSFATWLYNQAYLYCGGDDAVIIELAERFKNNDNYTKAEVALSNAIAEGGSVELYIALCQTYVEQDKLLDAASMLENITDPVIKAQLNDLRPAAPVATPDPGFYSQYITLGFEPVENERLYVSLDGDFPSVKTDLYSESLPLLGGENTVYAIAVGENGLVSESVFYAYTIGGIIEEVTISDPVMDRLIREKLGVAADARLMTDDLWQITELTVPADATDLSDLSNLTYLQTLVIENVNVSSLQMLAPLSQLKQLTVRGCSLSGADLTVIGSLPGLEHLVLSDCSISKIDGLSKSLRLVTLDLSKNTIRDLTALSFMTNLTTLDLSNNALTDLSPLSALTSLQELNVSYNSLTSIAPLSTCTSLTKLNAAGNQLDHLTAFPSIALTYLDLSNNLLTDVSALSGMTALTELDLSKNKLTDISALATLNSLSSLRFSRNQVTALPKWEASCALTAIDGSHNKLTSVAPLKGLMHLNKVNFDYNNISNINDLAQCGMLIKVDVFGNPIKSVSKLTDLNIIVNYDPT